MGLARSLRQSGGYGVWKSLGPDPQILKSSTSPRAPTPLGKLFRSGAVRAVGVQGAGHLYTAPLGGPGKLAGQPGSRAGTHAYPDTHPKLYPNYVP